LFLSFTGGFCFLKVKIVQPESWKRILEIEIPKEEANEEFNKKISVYKKKINLPGFRPGKVPLTLLKNRFGKSIFAETVDDLVQKNFEAACKDNDISPISKGVISAIKGEEGTDVSFTIETEVDPSIEINGYDKLKIKISPVTIKEEDVEKALEDLRERNAEFKDFGKPAEKGKFITLEYIKVVIDGEERKDFKNPAYPVELGKGQLKDFDKRLIGCNVGETVDVSVKFPKDFSGEQLAGKLGIFTVKINKITEKLLPEINEDFLKKLGDFATFDVLKEHIRKDLEQQSEERVKNEAYNNAIDTLIKNNPFDVPPSRIENYIDNLMEELLRYRRGNDPVPNREEVAEKYHESAVRAIKRFRIIDYIATKEKIKAAQEDLDKEIDKIAKMYNQTFEQVKQIFRQNGTTNRIRADIREQKTLDYLIGKYIPEPQSSVTA
jgi:trigger factor